MSTAAGTSESFGSMLRTAGGGLEFLAGEGAWQRFLFGSRLDSPPEEFACAGRWLRDRVLAETGVLGRLAHEHGCDWDQVPEEDRAMMLVPGAVPADPGTDVAAMLLRAIKPDWDWDRAYSRIAPHRTARDLTPLIPTDISTLRHNLLPETAFIAHRRRRPQGRAVYATIAPLAAAAYLARPHTHFIPSDLALDVATTALPDGDMLAALRLPGPWNLVFHDAVPAAAVQADDDELAELIDQGRGAGRETVVLGGLLAADPDGTVNTTVGFLLTSGLLEDGRHHTIQPVAFGEHPAGRLLYSYAAQLGFGDWLAAPAAPAQERGKPGSASQLKRLARTPQAQAGALHHVRVLAYTPPPETDVPDPRRPDPTRKLTHGTFRRAYWKPGTRIGIRDEAGRLVGPVYKTGEEGVTYRRERRWIRGSRVRADLPLREECTVYELAAAEPSPQ